MSAQGSRRPGLRVPRLVRGKDVKVWEGGQCWTRLQCFLAGQTSQSTNPGNYLRNAILKDDEVKTEMQGEGQSVLSGEKPYSKRGRLVQEKRRVWFIGKGIERRSATS